MFKVKVVVCAVVCVTMIFGGDVAKAGIININFGYIGPEVVTGWNNLTGAQAGLNNYLRENMVDSSGSATPVDLRMVDGFYNIRNSTAGTQTSTAFSPAYPQATKNNMYIYEGDADHSVAIRIEGLIPSMTYKFGFFDSYMSDNNVRRTCKYIIGTQSVTLVPNYNVNNVAYLSDISPDVDGNVLITLGFGAAPEVLNKVCGLAVMTVEGTFVPEPASLLLLGLGSVAFLKRKKNR
jgi:hypothetical protein